MARGTGTNRDFSRQVPVYGNIQLDTDEISALALPPKYCTLAKLLDRDARFESCLCTTKARWSRRTNGSPDEQEEEAQAKVEDDSDQNTRMDQDITEQSPREVYNPDTKILDYRRLKATDMVDNPRVELPPPRPQTEEQTLAAKELIWQDKIKKYINCHCNDKGDQKNTNLTKSQRRGIAKLRARTKAGEIVITVTDKSGKMSVSSRENYRQQGAPHTRRDEKVTWREIETAKSEIAHHTRAVTNIFKMGEDWGEKGEWRVRRTMHEQSTVVPQMHCTQKDHKELPESGIPKT